jgi:ADP-ribose pyrophosphatase YjhB (NUDIX family)
MAQKYKVYFANRPVFFTHSGDALIEKGNGTSIIASRGKMDTLLIENAIAQGAKRIYITSDDLEGSWNDFRNQFSFVQAAGGLVVNADKRILFIYRMEKWDLPKGKVEDGENVAQAALREVEEECSIDELDLKEELCVTWHTYIQQGEPMLKATSWFLMKYLGTRLPSPQLFEGITETRWIGLDEIQVVKSNTYPSVLEVIAAYIAHSQLPHK